MTAALEHPAELHQHHRDVSGGWLRPATFGVMDGLVSNVALVTGVLGGGASTHSVVVTGMAGLVAGACSMAVGEYTSVTSQADLVRAEINREQREIENNPADEERELAQIFERKGVSADLAGGVARELSANREEAWRTHVREELGVDPDDLPSPMVAAGASFASFALGAFVPVLPFLFGVSAVLPALLLTAFALLVTGGIVARLTACSLWFGGARQLLLGALSASVTFAVGLLVGTGLS
jgi:VIT1/CCC1 family predicted Fe2+/Mn2+ transporter